VSLLEITLIGVIGLLCLVKVGIYVNKLIKMIRFNNLTAISANAGVTDLIYYVNKENKDINYRVDNLIDDIREIKNEGKVDDTTKI
jgi:hypothetical protein